jgi:hypothetical protein
MHFSLSLMFDEASDIQMHGNLNVFVNVCLYTGEVRTFTLALKGEIVRVILPLTHNMLAINNVLLVMYVWPLLKK